MRVLLCAALLARLALAQMPETNPILLIDIFRAMQVSKRSENTLMDDDIADLGGVVKYVATECLAESDVAHVPGGDPNRNWPNSRKYNIDGVVRYRFKVHTPMDIIHDSGAAGLADFGPFVTFDQGVSSNLYFIKVTKEYGEAIGIQIQPSHGRFAAGSNLPIYWFSATGLCPNIAWKGLKDPITGAVSQGKGTRANPAPGCMRYGWKSAESASFADCKVPCPAGFPKDECYNKCTKLPCPYPPHCYDSVIGGLCEGGEEGENGTNVPKMDPRGRANCTYAYGKPDFVYFDDVVGIKSEDCGGRKCTGWKDFRDHCTNDKLKRRFDPNGKIVDAKSPDGTAKVCVEFDMHPFCRLGAGCDDPRCQKLLAAGTEIEVGLPWWIGRCEPKANRKRMEGIMMGFKNPKLAGAGTSHLLVDEGLMTTDYTPCNRPKDGPINKMLCYPVAAKGGPYCYRGFSGICQGCYVPNTTSIDPLSASNPVCPIGAVSMPDYKDLPMPTCKSNKVEDVCCLYSKTCEGGDGDPKTAPLTDEGLTLVAARQSTEDMQVFLQRVANEVGGKGTHDDVKFKDLAYWSWLPIPEKQSLDNVKKDLLSCNCVASNGPGPGPSPGPGPGGPGDGPPMWLIIVIILVVVCLCASGGVFLMRKKGGGGGPLGVSIQENQVAREALAPGAQAS